MGTVTIQNETTKNPISLIGQEAGICWNGKNDIEHNYKRGIDCIDSNHGRTLEYPQIYMVLDGYSARVIRELYTHIGGSPTRLQSSTRYIDYEHGFDYVVPHSIENNVGAKTIYEATMKTIADNLTLLDNLGIKKEDSGMLLPLGMTTKVVVRTNLRNLVDMSRQRLCTRAYWEFRELMKDIIDALNEYSDEWNDLVTELNVFKPKCEEYGYCTEKYSCGRKEKRCN